MIRQLFVTALLGITLIASGCSKQDDVPVAQATAAKRVATSSPASAGADFSSRTDKLKFRDGAGQTLFSLKFKADGAKLVDGQEKELARLKFEKRDDGSELKIKSPDEKTIGYLTGAAPKWKLKDAQKAVTLFQIHREVDGSYKIEDGDDRLLLRLRSSADGLRVEDARHADVFTVLAEKGKTIARDPSGKALLMTTDAVTPAAFAFLAMEPLPLPQRAAAFVVLNEKNPQ